MLMTASTTVLSQMLSTTFYRLGGDSRPQQKVDKLSSKQDTGLGLRQQAVGPEQ